MNHALKHPSAWVPIVLSLTMLATILITLSVVGVPTHEANQDEGLGAHLFQLWLVTEVFLIGFFAATQLQRKPKQTPAVLILQILAVALACAPVFLLHL